VTEDIHDLYNLNATVWCGIPETSITFDGNVNGEMYVAIMSEVLEPRLGDTSRRLGFHQDGVLPSTVFTGDM
jgi:hypothetical protein